MEKNKIGKYLKYAIGEIVLVVIGILIALQVNNWNETRKKINVETRLLNEFVTSLSEDINTLKFNIDIHNQAINSSNIVLNALNNNSEFTDSLAYHFAAVYYYTRFDCSRGPYESLKSMGFGIISDEFLKYGIIDYYDKYNSILNGNGKVLSEDILELKRNFNQDYFDKFHILIPNEPFYEGEMIPNDFMQLKSNKTYKYYIRTLQSSHVFFNGVNRIVLNKAEELIKLCKQEMN